MNDNVFELGRKIDFVLNIQEADKLRFQRMVDWTGTMMDLTIKERTVQIEPLRGDIYLCQLGENIGAELNKIRPVVIVSNNIGNKNASIVTVVPISHKQPSLPTHVAIESHGQLEGTALTEQMRVCSKARLTKKVGQLSPESLKGINQAINVSLGL